MVYLRVYTVWTAEGMKRAYMVRYNRKGIPWVRSSETNAYGWKMCRHSEYFIQDSVDTWSVWWQNTDQTQDFIILYNSILLFDVSYSYMCVIWYDYICHYIKILFLRENM